MIFAVYLFAGVILFIGLGNLFTYVLQASFIFVPRRLDRDYRYCFDEPFEELNIPVRRGEINALWFRREAAGGGSRPVILYCHGNSGNLVRWGNLYRFFYGHGCDFFVFDYRGFGKSFGPRNEALMHEDAMEAYRFVRRFYDPEQIIIFGRSMGSAFACRLAADAPARMLILETPFAGLPELFYTYYPFLPKVFLFRYRFANRRYLEQVSCPVFIFQGTDDWTVPFRCASQLRGALKAGDEFITVEMGRHNDLMIYETYHLKMEEILKEAT